MTEHRPGAGGLLVGGCLLVGVSHLSYVFFLSVNYRLALYAVLGAALALAALSGRPAGGDGLAPRYRDACFVALLCLAPWLCSLPGWLLRAAPYHGLAQESARVALLGLWGWSATVLLRSRRDVDSLLQLLKLAVALLGVIAILEHFGLVAPSLLSAGGPRPSATFGNPNLLAAYLAALLPLLAAHSCAALARDGAGPATLGSGLALAPGFAAVLLTGSRISSLVAMAGLAALLAGAALTAGRVPSRRHAWSGLLGVLALIVLVRAVGQLPDLNVMDPYFFDNRIPVWSAAAAAFRDAPLLGHGPGSFAQSYSDYALPTARAYAVHSNRYAHAEVLEVLQDGGLLAGLAWAMVWLLIGRRLWQLYRALPDRPDRLLVIGLLLSLGAYLSVSFFSIATRTVSVSILLPVLLAILCALAPRRRDMGVETGQETGQEMDQNTDQGTGQAPARKVSRLRAAMPAVLLVLLAVSALPWLASYRDVRRYQQAVEGNDAAAYTALDSRIDSLDNPYLLYELMKRYLAFSDAPRLAQAASALRAVAPHFRDADYFDVMLAVLQGDIRAARQRARAFQGRDRYHAENRRFLAMLAINTGDWALLRDQFQALTELEAYRARVAGIRDPAQAGFRFDAAVEAARFAPRELIVALNPALVLEVLNLPPALALERLQQSFAPAANETEAAFLARWVSAAGFMLGKSS